MSRSSLRIVIVFVLVGAASVAVPGAWAQPETSGPPIDVIKIEGAIDGPLLSFLQERLDRSAADGAVVVVQLDSAGSLGTDAVALADRLAAMPVPVLVWVGAVPARASGGALLMTYSASLVGVAPGSQTGPLIPVDLGSPGDVPPGLDASIEGWLAGRARTPDRTFEDEAMTAQQALDRGFAEVASPSVLDFVNAVDGRTVQTPGGPVVLRTKIATTDADVEAGVGVVLRFNEPGPVKRLQHGVATPSMIYVLLVLGLASIAFELTQPGFGFAGFAGLFLVGLAGYGIWVVPPSWPGFAVMAGAHGLLVLDVVRRRFGPPTIAGVGAFAAGSWLAYGGVADAIRISPWLLGGATVGAFLYYGFVLTVALQSRDRIISTQQGLIGLVGEARGRLAPDGPVFVKGAMWRGRNLGGEPIAPGSKVRIRGVDGLVLKVEAEPGDLGEAGPGPADGR